MLRKIRAVNIPPVFAGFIGGPTEPELPSEDEIRQQRIASARKCHHWEELDPADLIPRGPRFLVSASTDAVFVPYAGAVWNALGGIDFAEQNPLNFTIDGGDVQLYERQPWTWSERVYQRERGAAGSR
jgi:hypothetical protein